MTSAPILPTDGRLPTLSVIMPNYNHAELLGRSIESILRQSRPPDEFLIVDDASTDGSWDLLNDYAGRVPYIRLFRNPTNQGVLSTVNRLLTLARGDYVHWTASDDERHPAFFESGLKLAARYPEAGAILGKLQMMAEDGSDLGVIGVKRWQHSCYASPEQYLRDCFNAEEPSHSLSSSTIFHRTRLLEVGLLPKELGSYADTFLLHTTALKHGVAYFPEVGAIWHRRSSSYSQTTIADPRRTLDIINRTAQQMSLPQYQDYFPSAVIARWRRRYVWRTVKEFWRCDNSNEIPLGASFCERYRHRLPRTWAALSLLWHSGDSSASGL